MSQTRLSLRPATPADFRAYAGRDPVPEWSVEWWGEVAEQDGSIVGIGIMSRDEYGRYWAWTDSRGRLSPFLLHRAVRRQMADLAARGVTELRAYCSDKLPSAPVWLARLGFRPDASLPAYKGRGVWLCDLST